MAIKLHGKEYIEVKDRVTMAHAQESYSMLREETFSLGGREYVRVYIDVKGKQYIGTAEIKFNANPKTPDGMSPFECGETSALGRALGFAGYGVVDSIASADEVASNEQQTTSKHTEQANGHQSPFDQIGALLDAFCGTALADRPRRLKVLREALDTAEGPLPQRDEYTPDDVLRVDLYVKQQKASAGAGR